MYHRVPIITRAAFNTIFESVDVNFEHVARCRGVRGAIYLECSLTSRGFNSVRGVQIAAIIDWGREGAGLRRSYTRWTCGDGGCRG